MIEGIRGFPLLEGVRGEAPADLELLIEVLLRIAQLSQRHPRILELDINPFLAAPNRAGALVQLVPDTARFAEPDYFRALQELLAASIVVEG